MPYLYVTSMFYGDYLPPNNLAASYACRHFDFDLRYSAMVTLLWGRLRHLRSWWFVLSPICKMLHFDLYISNGFFQAGK